MKRTTARELAIQLSFAAAASGVAPEQMLDSFFDREHYESLGAEIAELIGIKSLNRGVKVQFSEDQIIVDVIITVSYGSNVVSVARQVQEKVINAVQVATGLEKAQVNVHVSGIAFEK